MLYRTVYSASFTTESLGAVLSECRSNNPEIEELCAVADWSTGRDQEKNQAKTTPDFFVGKGSKVTGTLEAQGLVVIAGIVEGSIRGAAELKVFSDAQIKGNVSAKKAEVQGKIRGDVFCDERLALLSGADLEGDIRSPALVIEEGVRFKGRCSMEPVVRKEESAPEQKPASEQKAIELPKALEKAEVTARRIIVRDEAPKELKELDSGKDEAQQEQLV